MIRADAPLISIAADRDGDGDVAGWRYSPTSSDSVVLSKLGKRHVRMLIIND